MNLNRLLMIALLVGTVGVIGCGDDSSGGNGNGVDPNTLCNAELCIDNAGLKQVCIDEITDCIDAGVRTEEQCIAFGTETCTA